MGIMSKICGHSSTKITERIYAKHISFNSILKT